MDTEMLAHPIDGRARRAATDIIRLADARPLPLSTPRRKRRRPPWTIALATAAVVALVVSGLVALNRRATPADVPDPRPTNWIIGDPPGGLAATLRSDHRPWPAQSASFVSVYATGDGPLGTVVMVTEPSAIDVAAGVDSSGAELPSGAQAIYERVVDGRQITVATLPNRRRLALFKIGGVGWRMHTTPLTDDQVFRLAGAVVAGPDGHATIPDNALPDDVTLVGSGTSQVLGATTSLSAIADTTRVDYTGTQDDRTRLAFAFGPRSAAEEASLAVFEQLTPTQVNDDPGWLASSAGGVPLLVWRHGDELFALAANDPPIQSDVDLLTVARSVRPATATEWSAIPTSSAQPTAPEGTTNATIAATPGDGGPPDTASPVTLAQGVEPVDTDIVVTATSVTPNEMTVRDELADGTSYETSFVVLTSAVRIQAGAGAQGGFYTLNLPMSVDPALQPISDDRFSGVTVVTQRSDAASLRVLRSNGERYTTPLTSAAAHPNVRFAAILFPAHQMYGFELLAKDGSVIASFGRH